MQRGGGLSTQHPLSSRIPARSGGGSAGMWPEPEGTSAWPRSPVSPRDGPIWRGLGSHANHITGPPVCPLLSCSHWLAAGTLRCGPCSCPTAWGSVAGTASSGQVCSQQPLLQLHFGVKTQL